MPNHFLTVGLCSHDWRRAELLGKDEKDIDFVPLNGANLCELMAPLPAELASIVAASPRCRYVHATTGAVLQSVNGPEPHDHGQWREVALTDAEVAQLTTQYGAADWFDWQNANWGTKWGTYELIIHKLGGDGSPVLIEFQSAWRPPSPQMMRKIDNYLCETYCLHNFKWIGHDPSGETTLDVEIDP